MCIIAVKKQGVKMPKDKVLKKMFDSNSDGAGYMIKRSTENKISLRKGFMGFDEFNKSIKSESIKDDDIVVMHFRIATVGGRVKNLTHPFVAEKTADAAEVLSCDTDRTCMVHNGTMSDYQNAARELGRSDSSLFASLVMSSDVINSNLEDPAILSLLESKIRGSRMAIINPRFHKVFILGEWDSGNGIDYKWNESKDGMLYSNHSWEISEIPFHRGFRSTYEVSIDKANKNKQTHQAGLNAKVKDKSPRKTNHYYEESLDDQYNSRNSTEVESNESSWILDEFNSLSAEEAASFLNFISLRKFEFVEKVKKGKISWDAFVNMNIAWCDDNLGDDDVIPYSNSDNVIRYRSGLMVGNDGKTEDIIPGKISKIEHCVCCHTHIDVLRRAGISYKAATTKKLGTIVICEECEAEHGHFYGII